MDLPRLIIAGTHSGIGKTTLTLGIIAALKKRGLNVQPFKTGPDYIDPSYHFKVSGKACGNLDSWLLSKNTVLELFERRARNADISVIEGVMGLYDGAKDSEKGSTCHLAKILNSPVILILDAHSLSRSAAAIALGYKEFDKKINIRGIILNHIASADHYSYVKTSIEKRTKIPVLGYLPRDHSLKLPERHLGLIPLQEERLHQSFYQRVSKLVEQTIDLAKLLKIARNAKPLPDSEKQVFKKERSSRNHVTIAVAKDEAFNFYYQDNLDLLKHLGAKISSFSPLRDKKLPPITQGLYIGGGFPELFAAGLSKNKKLKELICQKAKEGLPIYAECGGLMYLVKTLIDFKKRRFPMVGIFEGTVKMGNRLHRLGYVNIEVIKDNILSHRGDKNKAHVFHWSRLEDIPKNTSFAYKIIKSGKMIAYDGLTKKNVLAGYAHLHFASHTKFAKNFINSCRQFKIDHA